MEGFLVCQGRVGFQSIFLASTVEEAGERGSEFRLRKKRGLRRKETSRRR